MMPLGAAWLLGGFLLGALGVWMMLPGAPAGRRAPGTVLAAIGAGLLAAALPGVGDWLAGSVFYVLAGMTLAGAAATLTFRSPVYAAISFGLSLLGTAGLLFFQGAQFLGAATVVVYAGAILVTFLFVLMLAEPRGRAPYDRVGFGPGMAVLCGALLVAMLTAALVSAARQPEGLPRSAASAESRHQRILAEQHVKQLGDELFGRHLVAIQAAGALLLAALVGAAVIVGPGRSILPGLKGSKGSQPPAVPRPGEPQPLPRSNTRG